LPKNPVEGGVNKNDRTAPTTRARQFRGQPGGAIKPSNREVGNFRPAAGIEASVIPALVCRNHSGLAALICSNP
jgi:hypothetical protein